MDMLTRKLKLQNKNYLGIQKLKNTISEIKNSVEGVTVDWREQKIGRQGVESFGLDNLN